MGLTGIWRVDAQPQQSLPRVPIAAQGQQPPCMASQLAMAVAVIGMSWPQPGEPRIQQPAHLHPVSQIVPLTLKYGDQPPIVGPLQIEDVAITRAAWPDENEPRIKQPQQTTPSKIVPLTLVYGQQPPIIGPLSIEDVYIIRTAFPNENEPRVIQPAQTTPSKIVPLTLVYGQQPRPIGALQIEGLPVAQWPPAWWSSQSSPPGAAQLAVIIPPQPCPLPSASAAVGQWPAAWYPPQELIEIASLISVPSSIAPSVPVSVQCAWPAMWWPAQSAAPVAPLTLPYGQQPPTTGSMTALAVSAIVAQWPPAWNAAQSPAPNAAWSGTVLVVAQPYPPPQFGISAWPAPWYPSQTLVSVAPLTLVYGAQPPVSGPITPARLSSITAQHPAPWWPARSVAPVAALAGTVIVVTQPLAPAQIAQAILGTWPALWTPAQSSAPTAAWNTAPITPLVLALNTGRGITEQWYAALRWQIVPFPGSTLFDTAAWNIPVVSPHTAPARFPYDALWQRIAVEMPWNGSQITQPGGSWIISVAVVVASGVHGKYKPEHDSALVTLAGLADFSLEHRQTLIDLGDAGV